MLVVIFIYLFGNQYVRQNNLHLTTANIL